MCDQYEPLDIQNMRFHRVDYTFDAMELIDSKKANSLLCFLAETLSSKRDAIILSEMEKMGFTWDFIQEHASDFSRLVFDGIDREIFYYKQKPILEIVWALSYSEDCYMRENQEAVRVEYNTRTFGFEL